MYKKEVYLILYDKQHRITTYIHFDSISIKYSCAWSVCWNVSVEFVTIAVPFN